MDIYCFRKRKRIQREVICRHCLFRFRCRPFQLWLQPELPFDFYACSSASSVFIAQNDVRVALDALFPAERELLRRQAMKALPENRQPDSTIVRIKMYELMTGKGETS